MIGQREFDTAFRQYYERLYVFALQYIRAEQDCRDIVSACFERLWITRDKIDGDRVGQMLYVMVRNRCIDLLRKDANQQEYVAYVERTAAYVDNPDDWLERQERERVIQQRLSRLDPKARHVLEECYVNGKKYKEVAAEMAISEATVNKYMVRALKTIRLRE